MAVLCYRSCSCAKISVAALISSLDIQDLIGGYGARYNSRETFYPPCDSITSLKVYVSGDLP
jgi:hypothetical protein